MEFITNVLKGYKEKLHWPEERISYHTKIGAKECFVLALMVLAVVALKLIFGSKSSRRPQDPFRTTQEVPQREVGQGMSHS